MPAVMNHDAGRRPAPRVVPEAPPHDLALEREVLAACITFPELIDTLELAATDFFSGQHSIIYAALSQMRRQGDGIGTLELREFLAESKVLSAVGGAEYLLDLTSGIPTRTVSSARLKRLSRMRAIESLAHEVAISARADEPVDHLYEQLCRAKEELDQLGAPKAPHPLLARWHTLGTLGLLSTEPPVREWLLKRPHELPGLNAIGAMQLGKVGLLIAAGGVGKTIVLIQLALAVASGRKWLDHFEVSAPGRVLIALAEEDLEEVHRRFFQLARAMRLTDQQAERAAASIVVLPLCGVPVRLVDQAGAETEMLATLRARLDDGDGPWRLIILDPLSRFAGADTEKDNAQATRFIEAAETLLEAPGRPAVLIAHHTHKLSRVQDGQKASTSHARGASALTDGARWSAELEPLDADRARFTLTKSNYASTTGGALELVRDADMGGYLRAATPAERAEAHAAREAEQLREALDLEARIIRSLAQTPDQNKSQLAKALSARQQDVSRTIDAMRAAGKLRPSSDYGYTLIAPPPDPQGELL